MDRAGEALGRAGLWAALRDAGARGNAAREAGWRRTGRDERIAEPRRRALDAEPIEKGMMLCPGRRRRARGEISRGARG